MTITNSLAGNDTSPMQQQEDTSNHDKHMKCATHLLSIMNWIAVRNQGKRSRTPRETRCAGSTSVPSRRHSQANVHTRTHEFSPGYNEAIKHTITTPTRSYERGHKSSARKHTKQSRNANLDSTHIFSGLNGCAVFTLSGWSDIRFVCKSSSTTRTRSDRNYHL